jgi:hypothetical protein
MSDRQYDYHQKAYICIHVFKREQPVLLVNREGGDWQFLCGQVHEQAGSQLRVVGIGHVLEHDPTLLPLTDLPPEWEAERESVDDEWVRVPLISKPDQAI